LSNFFKETMKTKNTTLPTQDLSDQQISEMWDLFQCYYSNVNQKQFKTDLSNKSFVFLIIDDLSSKIVGFSTVKEFYLNNSDAKFIFSGDTIVSQDYWGNNNLGFEFSKYLLKQKLKYPFKKIYWNLISKGYKTYLLLANNFDEYYPNPFRNTPKEIQVLIDQCGEYLYQKNYNKVSGCIEFPTDGSEKKDCLKSGFCEISTTLALRNKKIEFFQKANPDWRRGDELVCIGEFTLDLLFKRFFKFITKKSKLKVLFPKTSEIN